LLHLQVEHQVRHITLDILHELLKSTIGLTLVLDERIPLPHSPQADAVAQLVHGRQMTNPACVDDAQEQQPFYLAHRIRAELGLTFLIALPRKRHDLLLDLTRALPLPGSRPVPCGQPNHPVDCLMQARKVPVVIIALGCRLYHPAELVFQDAEYKGAQV